MILPRLLRTVLTLVAMGLFSEGVLAENATVTPPSLEALPTEEPPASPTTTPEPNSALLAGLGGIALLLFALRRK